VVGPPAGVAQHLWWAGLGPVLPHDDFPADCNLCHVGREWNTLVDDFQFDHAAETGVPLEGAHQRASCIRCHNDRGQVATFQAQGCAGCHEDIHLGTLGATCTDCHQQETWQAVGQIAQHNRTRFPLIGAHATAACIRCHEGADVGRFTPTSAECVTCHSYRLFQTTNHVGLGWVDRCDRCHIPTEWRQGVIGS